jgi:hypothetical protein
LRVHKGGAKASKGLVQAISDMHIIVQI